MHRFEYRRGELWCEEVRVSEVAERLGTPLYLYSTGTLLDHFRKIRTAFAPIKPLICYAMKANSSMAICRALMKAGAGFDVVSGGEMDKLRALSWQPKKVVYASVGKTRREIETSVRHGILAFNVESAQELEHIEEAARRLHRRQRVGLRLNPGVEPDTHSFITTGHPASKFGMDAQTVESLLARSREFPHLILDGLHLHIGSQILEARPFQAAIAKALGVVARARRLGIRIRWLNIGGGLGIVYRRETPQTAQDFADQVLPLLKGSGLKIILEPGRFIVGNSGILLTRVLYLKESRLRRFAIVDAGMNDLIRPTLYGAYHEIVPVVQNKASKRAHLRYDVVGPICESGDFFARNRLLPPLFPGELLAILGAGAYGFSMASNYNSRPRAAEALVRGRRWFVVRRRETLRDLTRGERIPPFLR